MKRGFYEIHVGYEYLHICNKNKPKEVIKHILSHKSDELCISAISYGELMHGVEKSTYREKNYLALSLFYHQLQFYNLMVLQRKSMVWCVLDLKLWEHQSGQWIL